MNAYRQQKKAWSKGRRKAVRPFKGLSFLMAILFIVCCIALYIVEWFPMSFDLVTDSSRYTIKNPNPNAQYFQSDFASDEERVEYGKQLSQTVEAEGAALLKNDSGALPLPAGAKVSLIGNASTNPVYGGTGSAGLDTSEVKTFKQALEDNGFKVNSDLWSFYTEGAGAEYSRKAPSGMVATAEDTYSANEVPLSAYGDAEWNSISEYGDAAIMVVSRVGGEGADLPSNTTDAESAGYLGLDNNERDMLKKLKELKEAGKISRIIVLLNSSNSIQLDFLSNPAYDVDAVMWVGGMGGQGISAVADILSGLVNPSGRLTDTFLADNTTSPAMANFGSWDYTNAEEAGLTKYNGNYVIYQEGIYVGYRYYETRYEDYVMGTGNAGSFDYAADVAFPFGSGLSYTTFGYSNMQVAYDSASDTYKVQLDVTNTGSVAGKHTVEVFGQSPYTDYDRANDVEKSSVQLVGFDKTDELQPGETETVVVSVSGADLASFDAKGAKTYILDAGDYRLTVAADAHAAANNFLAAKGYTPTTTDGRMDAAGDASLVYTWNNPVLDTTTYATSAKTGAQITNQFDDADINAYEGASEDGVTYLSRADWDGTFPREVVKLTATEALVKELAYSRYDSGSYTGEYPNASMPTLGAKNGLKAMNLQGKDFDDPMWDELLDQLTADDMAYLLGSAFHYTQPIESIDLTGTRDENGPTGLTTTLFGGKETNVKTMGLPSEDVMGATYNTDLLNDVGRVIGNDCIAAGVSFLYGPGANIHRTSYSGRNFEYFSEDGFLSGKLLAAECAGIESKGAHVMIKHFALNDQELDRSGICVWANEQAIREVYLKAFEAAFTEADANGVMSSYSRVGAHWNGADRGMISGVLRGEWGCKGAVITDNSALNNHWMDGPDSVLAGADLFDSMTEIEYDQLLKHTKDPVVVSAMRDSCHRVIYSIVNSLAVNGMDVNSEVDAHDPGYLAAIKAATCGTGALTVLFIVLGCKRRIAYGRANPKPRKANFVA